MNILLLLYVFNFIVLIDCWYTIVWAVAGNWFKDAAENAPGMSSLELEEW